MMNNKRKDILKRGVDVTLYPLPFRKGGKIANTGLGDKNVKPGIEFANGGLIPGIGALRKKNPDAFAAEQHRKNLGQMSPLQFKAGGLMGAFTGGTGGPNDKPKGPYVTPDASKQYKDENEFNNHHLNLALQKLQQDDPMLYQVYQEQMAAGNTPNAQAVFAIKGGLPKYVKPSSAPPLNPTNWAALGSGTPQVGGYRYDAGQGKPASGSITNSSLGKRMSKFRKN
jgi:hypothetical protein